MARFVVIHHSPGVTSEDFQRTTPLVLQGKYATFIHCFANLVEGVIVNIYEGESAEAVGRELERIGFPFDEIQEIQFSASAEDLRRMMPTAT